MLNDTFNVVVPPEWGEEGNKHGANTCTDKQVGNYKLIIDETPNAGPAGTGIPGKG